MVPLKEIKKNCCYCGKIADSKDHIPSKCLLEKPFPDNLLTIPSCVTCNKSFSLDEEYLLNVLVEISTNPTLLAKKQIGGSVYNARERSPGLRDRIKKSLVRAEDGKIYFKSEFDRIKRVIEKNALGLFYHKYKKLAPLKAFNCTGFYPFSVDETRPAEIFLLTYTEKFVLKKWNTIQFDVFSYIIVRDWRRNNKFSMIFHVHNTAWFIIEIPFPNSGKYSKRKLISQLELFQG